MKILSYKKHSKEELIKRLRKVTLLHSSNTKNPIYIYKNAEIELTNLPVSTLMPENFYQIEEVLLKLRNLQEALREKNIDIFNLSGYVSYTTDESKNGYTLLPVIIEYQLEEDGSINAIILDGLHRISIARSQKLDTVRVIKIAKVSKEYPVFGYANPNGWQDVKLVQTVPDKKDKRLWRFPLEEVYKYYRDFNSAFENVGKPRTPKNP